MPSEQLALVASPAHTTRSSQSRSSQSVKPSVSLSMPSLQVVLLFSAPQNALHAKSRQSKKPLQSLSTPSVQAASLSSAPVGVQSPPPSGSRPQVVEGSQVTTLQHPRSLQSAKPLSSLSIPSLQSAAVFSPPIICASGMSMPPSGSSRSLHPTAAIAAATKRIVPSRM